MRPCPCASSSFALAAGLAVGRQRAFQELVVLAEQAPGPVVLFERDARALDALVLHLLVDERKRRRLLIVLGEVDDRRRQAGRGGSPALGGLRLGERRRPRRQQRAAQRRARTNWPPSRGKNGAGTSTINGML